MGVAHKYNRFPAGIEFGIRTLIHTTIKPGLATELLKTRTIWRFIEHEQMGRRLSDTRILDIVNCVGIKILKNRMMLPTFIHATGQKNSAGYSFKRAIHTLRSTHLMAFIRTGSF